MQRYSFLFILLLSVLMFSSCHRNKYDVDVSDIDVNIKIVRYDSLIYGLQKKDFIKNSIDLYKKYPIPSEIYFNVLLESGIIGDSMWSRPIDEVVLDEHTKQLHELIFKKYNSQEIIKLKGELDDAFRHYKYYFPDSTLPTIYTYVSNFSKTGVVSVIGSQSVMIALDMFLGSDHRYYSNLERYLRPYTNRENIVPSVIKSYFEDVFDPEIYAGKGRLLDYMVYEGKKLLFLEMMRPGIADSLAIQYSESQLEECKEYEGEFWQQLLENDVIYETDFNKTSRYLTEGPFTNAPGFSQVKAPPRIGQWIGWQIIKSYINEVEQSNLTDVFYEKDAQRILQKSRYKPKI